MRVLFILYANLEYLLEKISTSHNNPKMSSKTKTNKHTTSGYSLFTHCSFDATKNRLDYYRDQDCIEKFCKDLKEHEIKIIKFEKKEMIPLTDEENDFYENQKVFHKWKKEFIFNIDSCTENMYI